MIDVMNAQPSRKRNFEVPPADDWDTDDFLDDAGIAALQSKSKKLLPDLPAWDEADFNDDSCFIGLLFEIVCRAE